MQATDNGFVAGTLHVNLSFENENITRLYAGGMRMFRKENILSWNNGGL